MLVLKKEQRSALKKPFGKLYPSLEEAKQDFPDYDILISVGDVTTRNLLKSGLIPDIGIIDHKIQRKKSKHNIDYDSITLHVENPAGTITNELWSCIEEAFQLLEKNSHVLIIVEGEEDLSVLPCILSSPPGSIILYGQPNEGLVVVKADEVKNMAKDIIKEFKEV
ncbi:MAG: GTP-dependent dephospho-CoA kinase family protein [Methanomicrobiales archaeon]